MADDTLEPDSPPPDPFEAELVAYLDGELDAEASRRVEARLAKDPVARARAEALKKSFDLLDYLPRPDPSPTFTTRTLEQVPALKASATQTPNPAPSAGGRAPARTPGPLSTSMPVPIDDDLPTRGHRPRGRVRAAALAGVVVAFAAAGYLVAFAARPYLMPAPEKEPADSAKPVLPDPPIRVLEHLALYAGADDLWFVAELARPELFGDDPAVAYDPTLRVHPADVPEHPDPRQLESHARAFRALPPARQAEIERLDRQLFELDPATRGRYFRVLEAYACWLARLPDQKRRRILTAPTAAARVEAVAAVREEQWVDALPPPLKEQLEMLAVAEDRAALVRQWKDEETIRRDRWAFVRRHAEAFAANTSPWPFDTETGRNEVIAFATAAFRPDEGRRCRLSPEDRAEYHRTLALARSEGAWAWYGLLVYELSKLYPYLPEPENPKLLMTEITDLPNEYQFRLNPPKKGAFPPGPRYKLNSIGKWPDFPLEVLKEVPLFSKGPPPQLGPARLGEFKEPVRSFVVKELFPKLTGEERRELGRAEGKWPDYGRELVRLARKHDLSVPGAMPPGPPRKWDATYDIRSGPRP